MSYAIFTVQKTKGTGGGGGLSAHIDRVIWNPATEQYDVYTPQSVRHPERTALNKDYLLPGGKTRAQAIEDRIRSAGVTRKIKDTAVKCLNLVITSDHDKMAEIEQAGRLDEWAHDCIEFCREQFGADNVVAAALHMDEHTPHLHVAVVPIVQGQAPERRKRGETEEDRKKKRRYKKQQVTARLSAKEVFTPKNAVKWQTEFAAAMAKYGMERGIEGSSQKRTDPAKHNKEQLMQENKQLTADNSELKEQKYNLEEEKNALVREVVERGSAVAQMDLEVMKKEEEVNTLQDTIDSQEAQIRELDNIINTKISLADKAKDKVESIRLKAEIKDLEKQRQQIERQFADRLQEQSAAHKQQVEQLMAERSGDVEKARQAAAQDTIKEISQKISKEVSEVSKVSKVSSKAENADEIAQIVRNTFQNLSNEVAMHRQAADEQKKRADKAVADARKQITQAEKQKEKELSSLRHSYVAEIDKARQAAKESAEKEVRRSIIGQMKLANKKNNSATADASLMSLDEIISRWKRERQAMATYKAALKAFFNILYSSIILVRKAVEGISQRIKSPAQKKFTEEQAHDVADVLKTFGGDKKEDRQLFGQLMVDKATEDVGNVPEKWIQDAADDVKRIASGEQITVQKGRGMAR